MKETTDPNDKLKVISVLVRRLSLIISEIMRVLLDIFLSDQWRCIVLNLDERISGGWLNS